MILNVAPDRQTHYARKKGIKINLYRQKQKNRLYCKIGCCDRKILQEKNLNGKRIMLKT